MELNFLIHDCYCFYNLYYVMLNYRKVYDFSIYATFLFTSNDYICTLTVHNDKQIKPYFVFYIYKSAYKYSLSVKKISDVL